MLTALIDMVGDVVETLPEIDLFEYIIE